MNKIKIKRILAITLLSLSLLFGGYKVKASAETKPKILIYHTHTHEANINSNVVQIGEDLAKKLRNKNFTVEHIVEDFIQGDYNNAYYHSREKLKQLNLDEYFLVIDLHRDSFDKPLTTEVKGVDVAKLMFVTTSENPNLKQETNLINSITNNLDKFSEDIVRNPTTNYKSGISYYNADLSPNMLLIEMGDDKNTYIETQRANTYLSSAIKITYQNK